MNGLKLITKLNKDKCHLLLSVKKGDEKIWENAKQKLLEMKIRKNAICAQYMLCEYQPQLILPSLLSVFNIFIYSFIEKPSRSII